MLKRKLKSCVPVVLVVAAVSFILGAQTKEYLRYRVYLPLTMLFARPPAPPVSPPAPKVSDYDEVSCPANALGIGYFGQSNSANSVRPPASIEIPGNLFQYDWKTEKCYRYKEPLLGTDGYLGNTITYVAVRIARTLGRPVIIIPFGCSGTSILAWAYGYLSPHHDAVLVSLKKSGLSPKVFLWHQGESDVAEQNKRNGADEPYNAGDFREVPHFQLVPFIGLSRDGYKSALNVVVNKTLESFPDAQFGVALVSRCMERPASRALRNAQTEVIRENKKVFLSADSDEIAGDGMRYDGCHFSELGAKKLSDEYYRAIMKHLNSGVE